MTQVRLAYPSQDSDNATQEKSDAPAAEVVAATRASAFTRFAAMISQHLRRKPGASAAEKRRAWGNGVTWEFDFWDKFLEGRTDAWAADFAERMDPNLPLQPFLADLIRLPEGETVQILDVGAGPFTFVGRTSPRWKIEITAVDPLAKGYDLLLTQHGVTPPVRTRAVAAEDLRQTFPANSFDLVTARNCLDHVLDPVRALRQMLEVAKPGASLNLQHMTNEAERNLYAGMHQWNFRLRDGDFVIAGAGEEVNVTATLATVAHVSNILYDESWLVTTITKLAQAN
jgi:SAM-dependent methyltransferase